MTISQMTINATVNDTDLNRNQSESLPCPRWKKVLAGVLAVAAVALLIPGTVWFDQLEVSWREMLTGLAMGLGYSIAVVLIGIALVTLLLWAISRSQSIMSHGKSVMEYIVHCYPQNIKDRILHRT
jgi:formate/nitrite transporter FocA (FNT family)